VAQLANDVALELARRGIAQMSCIAGVGGDVPTLVRVARSGRFIIALDGCPLHCVKECLARHAVRPDYHLTLTEQGIRKGSGPAEDSSLHDSPRDSRRDTFVAQIAEEAGRLMHPPVRSMG